MSLMKLALQNFRASMKNYIALILSLAFAILILFDFQSIVYSDAFQVLGKQNKRYIDIVVQIISFVLLCFMFFFIWYSTNVFLSKRKKEIGIYVFMGLTNQKIGRLYMIENTLIGLTAVTAGLIVGIITQNLFQMILLALSDISVEIKFHLSWQPICITVGVYLVIYMIFAVKGYVNIVRSSVLEMVSAQKKNEYVRQKTWVLIVKTILGMVILVSGYYLAIKDSGEEKLQNALSATILVVVGVYLLFGGLIPFIFQKLAASKRFLYQKERNLWMNQLIFRMKKNYRTYAMVCILLLCSVTALATGFAMKEKCNNIITFRSTYTYQIVTNQTDLKDKLESLIQKDNQITRSSELTLLQLDSAEFEAKYQNAHYAVIAYSQLKCLADDMGMDFEWEHLNQNEIVDVTHLYLLSIMPNERVKVKIHGKTYEQIAETSVPYLGYLQEQSNYYMVSDEVYKELLPVGEELTVYNYKIKNEMNYKASLDDLNMIMVNDEKTYTGRVAIDPENSDIEWIKVLYSVCIFMFMVFVLASGSILFMKLYNDSFEEKERYLVLKKLGIEKSVLKKSIKKELRMTYIGPMVVMIASSYFSVHALQQVMMTNLLRINAASVLVILVFIVFCYCASVTVYEKNVGLK